MSSVREEIARIVVAHLSGLTIKGINKRKWGEVDAFVKFPYWERGLGVADSILSLKHPNGEPMLYVGAEDQSAPAVYSLAESDTQNNMIKANFRRIEAEHE